MQAGWSIEPTAIVSRNKIQYGLGDIDLSELFDNKEPYEAIRLLRKFVDEVLRVEGAKGCDNFYFEISRCNNEGEVPNVKLVGTRLETDEEVEQRRSVLVRNKAHRNHKDHLDYERLQKKFGGEFCD